MGPQNSDRCLHRINGGLHTDIHREDYVKTEADAADAVPSHEVPPAAQSWKRPGRDFFPKIIRLQP
jgi:hypothetical protein